MALGLDIFRFFFGIFGLRKWLREWHIFDSFFFFLTIFLSNVELTIKNSRKTVSVVTLLY